MFMIVEVMTETINNEIVLALTLVCAGTNSQKPANSPYYHAAISGDDEVIGNGDDEAFIRGSFRCLDFYPTHLIPAFSHLTLSSKLSALR